MVGCEARGFPYGALVAFGITEQGVDATLRALEPSSQSGTHCKRESMSQRSRSEIDSCQLVFGVHS